MSKYKAKFIVLEGIDGTGKTTTARQLKQYYESQAKSVKIYYEPYQFASFNVKDIIKNLEGEKVDVSDFAILNLMIASRDISIKNILIPALDWYDVVIADRYYYSTYAYQERLVNRFFDSYGFCIESFDYPSPDKILFFHIKDMDLYQNSKSDKFEIQDLEKFKRIQADYFEVFDSIDFNGELLGTRIYDKTINYIEVNQQKQPYFDFNQVLQALEEL